MLIVLVTTTTNMGSALLTLLLLLLQQNLVDSFAVWSNAPTVPCERAAARRRRDDRSYVLCMTSSRSFVLSAKRRGKLGSLVAEGLVDTGDIRKAPKSNGGKKKNTSQQVSPDLASYMASKEPESSGNSAVETQPNPKSNEQKTSSSSRRVRTTERMRFDEESSQEVKAIVSKLQDSIKEGKKVIEAVDEATEKLSKVNKLKQLVKSTAALDYRLAWVESDAAVCAIGSALHRKVGLARLQEVFLTLHRNRLQMFEVIRILGPFPNVKNTLSGSAKFSRKDKSNELTITWQSLIDGTGKENYEGGESKQVTLDVLHGDEQIIVASLIDETIPNDQNRLVFIRDEEMDTTLESLRVL